MNTARTLAIYTSTGPPVDDLAFEAWMIEQAENGRPCLTLYSWPSPTVVIGYGQPSGDVDLEWCRERDIPVLRRLTGGTGVVHLSDLAVSLALPKAHPWARGITSLYGTFLAPVCAALHELGSSATLDTQPARGGRERSPICFEDQLAETLLVDGRKAVGCAQARRARAVLVHAAVLLGLDAGVYAGVFGVSEARVRRALAPAVSGRGWREVATVVAERLADALELQPLRKARPVVPARWIDRYRSERWAPLTP